MLFINFNTKLSGITGFYNR